MSTRTILRLLVLVSGTGARGLAAGRIGTAGEEAATSRGKNSSIGKGDAELILKTNLLDYQGSIRTIDLFEVTETCNGTDFPVPLRNVPISIPPTDRGDLSEGETNLSGNTTRSSALGTFTYKWNLSAE